MCFSLYSNPEHYVFDRFLFPYLDRGAYNNNAPRSLKIEILFISTPITLISISKVELNITNLSSNRYNWSRSFVLYYELFFNNHGYSIKPKYIVGNNSYLLAVTRRKALQYWEFPKASQLLIGRRTIPSLAEFISVWKQVH